jgi:Transposase
MHLLGASRKWASNITPTNPTRRFLGLPQVGGHSRSGIRSPTESNTCMDKRTRRRFTPEFKAEAVALVRSSGKSTRQVARDLGLAETSLQRW